MGRIGGSRFRWGVGGLCWDQGGMMTETLHGQRPIPLPQAEPLTSCAPHLWKGTVAAASRVDPQLTNGWALA